MSHDAYDLVAYWGDRQESADACAARFAQMATQLAGIDPVFARWLQHGDSRAELNERFCKMPPDVDELARIFDANRSYRYNPPVVWPEVGFNIGVWNGHDDRHGVAMSVFAGAYGIGWPTINHAELLMGHWRLAGDQPWTGSMLNPVLMAVVDAWKPSFAAVRSGRYSRFIFGNQANKNYSWSAAGWLTYLSFPQALRVTPPEDAKSERFADGGLLVTLCEEPFDVDNPQHMAVADEMQRALRPVQW